MDKHELEQANGDSYLNRTSYLYHPENICYFEDGTMSSAIYAIDHNSEFYYYSQIFKASVNFQTFKERI